MKSTASNLSRLTLFVLLCSQGGLTEAATSDQLILGQLLFNDKNLSLNRNQACVSCHGLNPSGAITNLESRFASGFVDPINLSKRNAVSFGSISSRNGALNAPSIGYAAYSPLFHWDSKEGLYVGGQFWNGRANNLTEQAKQPFLNPVEMAMPSQWAVVSRLQQNPTYRQLFRSAFLLDLASRPKWPGTINSPPAAVTNAYKLIKT